MTDIFLSYSSKDRERVRPFQQALVAMGYEVFWDIETPAGENWDRWIRANIAKAKVVIVFWTKNSAASVNVQHEAAIAREDNKLVAAQLEIMRAIDFPMGFYTMQAPQLDSWTGQATHAGYSSLIKAVRKRFEGTPEQVAEVVRSEEAADIAALRERAETGDALAQLELGYRNAEGIFVPQDDHEAVRLWQLAAAQGNSAAERNLGVMYGAGRGGLVADEKEAVRLYKLAIEHGDPRSPFTLGVMYMEGAETVSRNEIEAERLFRLGVERGDANAQFALGFLIAFGRTGLAKDDREAARLFRLAAEQGLPEAEVALGFMCEQGSGGLPTDKSAAIRLYRLAAGKGNQLAEEALKRLGKWP
jgi:TPR repeat protein